MTGTLERRALGRTGLEVTTLCVGTSPLASMERLYGYGVDTERAVETVLAVLDSPIRFLDTSNGYGEDGAAEKRVGEAIRRIGGLPPDFVLQTKTDADTTTGDYSGDRVRRSVEESLERLGVDHLPLLALHDPEFMADGQDGLAPGGAVEAMVALQEEGVVDHLAVAAGSVPVTRRYLASGVFGAVLNHSRFTLLDRSAEGLFEEARAAGIGVMNAAPYGGGILSKGPGTQTKYGYGERGGVLLDRARAMEAACARHGVPLAAAALQFSTRSPLVDSTVIGLSSPERIDETLALLEVAVSNELWAELEALTPPREGWLD
jgi:D-threo-aldose 1-dehydrogenase